MSNSIIQDLRTKVAEQEAELAKQRAILEAADKHLKLLGAVADTALVYLVYPEEFESSKIKTVLRAAGYRVEE